MSLFDGVKFFCTSTLSDKRNADLTGLSPSSWSVMARNLYPLGKRPMQSRSRFTYGGKDGAKKGRLRVADFWADRSLILGRLQLWVSLLSSSLVDYYSRVHHFSPDPAMLFSGVVACVTNPVPSDIEVLSAGITALEGKWRAGLTSTPLVLDQRSIRLRYAIRRRKFRTDLKIPCDWHLRSLHGITHGHFYWCCSLWRRRRGSRCSAC
ncbi:hypothetical protein BJV77DRAFT_611014 [Russula vinacea]|nr:hypothetical protein BJV77DRAFT_611014 [Russula vinacea]